MGIPAEQQAALFEPFQQATPSDDLTRRGWGLYIAQPCLDRMGGEIWIERDGHSQTTFPFARSLAVGQARKSAD